MASQHNKLTYSAVVKGATVRNNPLTKEPSPVSKNEDRLDAREFEEVIQQGREDTRNTPRDFPDGDNAFDKIQQILPVLQEISQEKQNTGHQQRPEDTTETVVAVENASQASICEQPSTGDESETSFFNVPMPNSMDGPSTHGYNRVLASRIRYPKLSRGAEYDMRAYTPTFVHDSLMLPGTLAQVIGKDSQEEIIRRMTPALLPGFHPHVHATNQQPCIMQCSSDKDYVQGVVIFGQGTEARKKIHQHYRPQARRVKVEIEVEFLFPDASTQTWKPLRKKIWANAWIWANVGSVDMQSGWGSRWTLKSYLAGTLSAEPAMRIGHEGSIGDNWNMEEDEGNRTSEDAAGSSNSKRERGTAATGTLDYERSEAAIGWW